MTDGLGAYRREVKKARRSLEKDLRDGRASPVTIAIQRFTITLMEDELRTSPDRVRGYDNLREGPWSGAALWRKTRQEHAIKKYQPATVNPEAYRRKINEYLDFAERVIRSRAAWREYIRDTEAGVLYILSTNPKVDRVVKEILSALLEWARQHATEDDFYRLSAKEGLQRMLLERPDLVAVLRVAQTLPHDVKRIAIRIERPAHVEVIEMAIGFIPIVGSAVAIYESYTGRDLFGYKLDQVERSVLAASVLLPAAGRLTKGARSLYTARRLKRLYGHDAGEWSKVLSSSERLSANPEAYRAIRESEPTVRAGRNLNRAAATKVDRAVRTGFAKPGSVRTSVSNEVMEAFKKLSQDHPAIAELDELAIERVIRRGPNPDHMKGQLLEEILETRVTRWLQEPTGPAALGVDAAKNLEFIPGHLVRDAAGRQITDGIVGRRAGDGFEILAIFEAKAGKSAARELSLTSKSKSVLSAADRAELRSYARDVHRELTEQARLRGEKVGKTVDEIEAEIIGSERGGQVRRDIERLAEDASGKRAKLVIGSVEMPVTVSPTRTKVFGVLPRDLRTRRLKRNLRGLGYDFEVFGIDISQADLRSIANELSPPVTQ